MAFSTIISPTDLQAILASANTIVFDTRYSLSDPEYGRTKYVQGHIPGAFYLDLHDDLSSPITPTTGRHPLPKIDDVVELLRAHGVSSNSQVVAYDDAGGMFAARCWWLLRWLGHERVAVLDGGWPAWIRAGGAEDVSLPDSPPRGNVVPNVQRDLVVEASQVQAGLADSSMLLCDARAPERFRGDTEPMDKVAGHVPGAVNVPFAHNLDSNGRFKPVAELVRLHAHPRDGRRVVHMCGSGVTACHNVLAAVLSGQAMPALYAGSWSEWITDPERGVARGPSA